MPFHYVVNNLFGSAWYECTSVGAELVVDASRLDQVGRPIIAIVHATPAQQYLQLYTFAIERNQ